MKCRICDGDNTPEAVWCATCGASLTGTAPHAMASGSVLQGGAYTVVYALAQGGFGITYHCLDNRLECPVAVKEFFPLGCARQDGVVVPTGGWTRGTFANGRARFLQEGQTLAKFDHPGIVRVRAAFEENETAYIVMEFLRGRTLDEILRSRQAPLREDEVVAWLERVGVALAVVHGAGTLHRDLKPSNLMVTDDGRVVLIDFGTAREYASGLSQSHSTTLTEGYAPLEQYSRRGLRGPSSDIYSLAATGWHMLTGTPPPSATDRAVGAALPPLREVRAGVGAGIAAAVERGLAMDPAQRPQSVGEFVGLLQDGKPGVASDLPRTAPAPVFAQPPARVVHRRGRQPWLRWVALTVLVGAGLWGAGSTLEVRPSATPPAAPTPSGPPAPGGFVNAKDGSVLVPVPGGTYTVGSDNGSAEEKPAHAVTLAAYNIGKYEVTNAQFRRFTAATGHSPSSEWERAARDWGESAPVVCVSWNDATAYCEWAGLRLPTEAEWEAAARGADGRKYPWGDLWDAARCRTSIGTSSDGERAVGCYPTGASWCGALDMAGNASEWTASRFYRYPGNTSSEGFYHESECVVRGGSWLFDSPGIFRSASRGSLEPGYRVGSVGFRCARNL